MSDDFYTVLGISSTATLDEIKTRFRFLSHAYHPDKFGTNAHREAAEVEFKRINEAYQTLSDPIQRARFDASRPRSNTQQHPQSPPEAASQPRTPTPRGETVDELEKRRNALIRTAYTKAHAKQLGGGILAFCLGTGLSLFSYNAAQPGGHYLVAGGLILGGIIATFKGLFGLIRTQFGTLPATMPAPHTSPYTSRQSNQASSKQEDVSQVHRFVNGSCVRCGVGIKVLNEVGWNCPSTSKANNTASPL